MNEYKDDTIQQVWEKATIVPNNSDQFRQDFAGAWIKRSEYGKNTEFGWKIVAVKPKSDGGDDSDIENLFPFHWKNANAKKNEYPEWTSMVSSDGIKNIDKILNWIFNE